MPSDCGAIFFTLATAIKDARQLERDGAISSTDGSTVVLTPQRHEGQQAEEARFVDLKEDPYRREFGMISRISFIKIADRVEVSVDLKGKRISAPPIAFRPQL
jgi:hypothetical protein